MKIKIRIRPMPVWLCVVTLPAIALLFLLGLMFWIAGKLIEF